MAAVIFSICNGVFLDNVAGQPFEIIFKPNSYLMSISRRGRVNLSIPAFSNISLTETMTNLLVA